MRYHNIQETFLIEQVSALFHSKIPLKYNDPICPTISCVIGQFNIENTLFDMGARAYLLPYTMFKQLGLRELKPTLVTLQLVDRSV